MFVLICGVVNIVVLAVLWKVVANRIKSAKAQHSGWGIPAYLCGSLLFAVAGATTFIVMAARFAYDEALEVFCVFPLAFLFVWSVAGIPAGCAAIGFWATRRCLFSAKVLGCGAKVSLRQIAFGNFLRSHKEVTVMLLLVGLGLIMPACTISGSRLHPDVGINIRIDTNALSPEHGKTILIGGPQK